ncbi:MULTISPECIES: helix-turn-helix domain-containing protein [Chryseobacterium]|nr:MULTISPECIES: helix-turn-helix domain-containing protein [Chryseobacterium]
MITIKHPDKLEACSDILQKSKLNTFDVINLQKKIFGSENASIGQFNQRHKSYDKSTIIKILDYQRKNSLNNSELAIHFRLSRNTVAKWKKLFL